MTCCDAPKNQGLYLAATPTGYAVYCRKCGRAHPATRAEIDRIRAAGGGA